MEMKWLGTAGGNAVGQSKQTNCVFACLKCKGVILQFDQIATEISPSDIYFPWTTRTPAGDQG